MVIGFTGRKSGKAYSIPVGYMQTDQIVYCYTRSSWWLNLRGGTPVTVVIGGRQLTGIGYAVTDTAEIADGLDVYIRHKPREARFFRVELDENRHPRREDLVRAAGTIVQVRIDLDQPAVETDADQ